MFLLTGAGSLVASCLGACAMTACCTGMKELMHRSARMAYCLLFTLSMLLAWLLRDFAKPLMEKIPWIVRKEMPELPDSWYGKEAVYRVSLGNALFFGCLSLALIGVKYRGDKRGKLLQHGSWMLKVVMWLLFNALPFLLPNGVAEGYAWVARVGAGVFLVVQMLILLDFTHALNDTMVDSEDERALYVLLAATVGSYLASLGAVIAMFFWFKPHGAGPCSLNVFLIVASLILVTAFSVISIHPAAKHGSLFPSAVIGLYCVYLTYSALASEPHDYVCNGIGERLTAASGSALAFTMVGTLAAVVWSALRAGSNTALFTTSSSTPSPSERPLLETGGASASDEGDAEEAGEKAMDEFEPISYNYSFFHFIFMLASMYIGMLMTGWGVGAEEKDLIDVGWASVWVKMGAQWLIGLVYIWTLVAPAIFPDRDFA
mmetsp:Transcript_14820/g.41700  ORF Transcript_14820/g.41700 Transcript_14820/m.41700 type:complete len:432 (-) Transcript_14820:29-1324(-)